MTYRVDIHMLGAEVDDDGRVIAVIAVESPDDLTICQVDVTDDIEGTE